MPDFPVTYTTYDNGETDRRLSDDWWAWVKTEPQDAMLLWLRSSNWDNVSESWVGELIDNPGTDLSIIAVIYWGTSGGIEQPEYLPARIIGNLEKGHYRQSVLWLERNQFIEQALYQTGELRKANLKNFPNFFPRQLLGPFGSRKASVPSDYGKQVEEQIRLVEEEIEVTFHRSEDDYLAKRYKRSYREETLAESEARLARLQQPLPEDPVGAFAHLSDLDYLERYFCPLDDYVEFKRDPDEHKTPYASLEELNKYVRSNPYKRKERASIFYIASALAVAGYLIFASLLWLTGAFSKSDASHFGADFALSVIAVLILGGLAVLWRELNK